MALSPPSTQYRFNICDLLSLAVFAASPQFAGLVITEINPDHMDEEGEGARRFVRELVRALC